MKKLLTALLAIAILVSPVLAQTKIQIPTTVLASSFGKQHTFKLLSHGPNPIFSRAGYTFRVETFGYKLSDEYYYKVPVYVDFDKTNNMYRIYSTKEGVSVGLTVLTGPDKSSYVLPDRLLL